MSDTYYSIHMIVYGNVWGFEGYNRSRGRVPYPHPRTTPEPPQESTETSMIYTRYSSTGSPKVTRVRDYIRIRSVA